MKIGFGELLLSAWKQTKVVLFPFRFKKWLILGLIAIFAGEGIGGSLNFSFNLPAKPSPQSSEGIDVSCLKPFNFFEFVRENIYPIIIGIIVICILIIFLIWLSSRLKFVFLYDVVHNDASFKKPFRKIAKIGDSYFTWNIWFIVFTVGILCVLGYLGIETFKNISSVGPVGALIIGGSWVGIGLGFIVILGVIGSLVYNLALPIMLKKQVGITAAFKEIRKILRGHSWDYVKFLLVKVLLGIITGIGVTLFFLIGMLVVVIIGIIGGGILVAVGKMLPEEVGLFYYVVTGILGIVVLVAIGLVMRIATLPISVFFRIFSMKFLTKISPENDLFQLEENV